MAESCDSSQPEEPGGDFNPHAGLVDGGPKSLEETHTTENPTSKPSMQLTEQESLEAFTLVCASRGKQERDKKSETRLVRTSGEDAVQETRLVRTSGEDAVQETRLVRTSGEYAVQETRLVRTSGEDAVQETRLVRTSGEDAVQETRLVRTSGEDAVQETRLVRTSGEDAVQETRLVRTSGEDAVQETRLVRTSGEDAVQPSLQHASGKATVQTASHHTMGNNMPMSINIEGCSNMAVFMAPVSGSTFNFYPVVRQLKEDQPSSQAPLEDGSTHARDMEGLQPVGDTCRHSGVQTQVGDTCRHSGVHTQIGGTCRHSAQIGDTSRHSGVHAQVGDTCRHSVVPKIFEGSCGNSANQCNTKLTKHYKRTGSYVKLIPWINDDNMHIMDIYVKLHLQRTEGCALARNKVETVVDYEKIFQMKTREGDLINRVIFCGMAGLGKSTLFDKITYDWAVGSNEFLKNYKLVFLLKMCALDQESDLIKSIFDQLLGDNSGISEEELEFFIFNNSEEVLILLDGFDELVTTSLSEASFGSVLRSLRTMNFEGCIAVTTRPSHIEKLMGPSLVQSPCTHVKVLGFTQNDVKNYINKFYHDDLVSAASLLETIKCSDSLSDLAKSPMMLLLICLIWREKSKLPETLSQLYTEALTYIFKRKGPGFENSMSTVLVAIGKVALKGLLANDQKLAFSESDFNEMEFSTALKVGILSSQRVLKNLTSHQCIQFIHKTVQEYCAAKYWQSLLRDSREFQEILDVICQEGKSIHHFEYLLRFCCGSNQRCLGKILDSLSIRLLDGDGALHHLLIHCYFEAQLIEGRTSAPIKSLAIPQICVQKFHTEYFKALLHFLTHICKLEDSKMHLANIQSLHISGISLGGSLSMKSLADALGNMSNLVFLHLTGCSLAYRDVKLVTYYLIDDNQLTHLDLSGNDALGGDARLWAACLKNFASLKVIKLCKCNLQGEDLEHVLMAISKIASLTELDVSGNHSLGARGTANVWSTFLLVTHLEYLRLNGCNLRAEDLEHVAAALSNMSNLTCLDLSGNSALGGSAELWAHHLCRLYHLYKLDLGFCTLKYKDIGSIALSVTDLTNLKVIVLAGNRALGGKVHLWVDHLHHMQHVEKLDFSKCSFKGKDIEYLAVCLSERRHVTELDLSNNSALVGSAEDWSQHLCLMTHVQKLDLSGCLLILKDVRHVALSLSGMSNLRRLVLSMNSKWQGSAASWSGHLQHLKHLRELCLRCCFLTSKDIEAVAVLLSEMKKLTHLDLSANNTLGGSAHLWSRHLHLMKYLQNLHLSDCSLTGTDAEHIASALRDMAKMSELHLCRNTALGGSAHLWAHHLPHLKHLQQITLSCCFMTCADKSTVSQALHLTTNTLCVTY
ncbi:NACHT, LRR and PYD domains-containing protein 3-like isoform X2 [Asterias rubens]|uniref:NACHT, LRR and PYD domains-containing protein 3-like isoform X2 n=1 Tax=Asterias rubens TaxID=7604 RepID=UPI0014559A7C|nr:NACHT, LRR and PYD domains-containing protein 3-like isoform X2 [Asterias rubens]